MAETKQKTAQELHDELARVREAQAHTAERLAQIEALTHPVEPVQGAYKVGRTGKILINAALLSLALLVFVGRGYTGVVLAVFLALGVSGVIAGKVEAKKGTQRYEADMKIYEAEKKDFEEAQAELSPLKYEAAVLQQKARALQDALEKAE